MNKNRSSSNLSGKSREELNYIAKSIDLNKTRKKSSFFVKD